MMGGADWDTSMVISWVINEIITESIVYFSSIVCRNSVNNELLVEQMKEMTAIEVVT